MKTILLVVILALFSSVFMFNSASAVNVLSECTSNVANAGSSDVCQQAGQSSNQTNPVITILKNVIQLLAIVIGVLSVLMIMIAGLRMVVSNGDAQTISRSRDAILYSVIGIFVAVFAEALVLLVLSKVK
ncbi:MAG TPA: hypothetical protein VIH90_02275 [Candidatus Saccharimonadales bacterium]